MMRRMIAGFLCLSLAVFLFGCSGRGRTECAETLMQCFSVPFVCGFEAECDGQKTVCGTISRTDAGDVVTITDPQSNAKTTFLFADGSVSLCTGAGSGGDPLYIPVTLPDANTANGSPTDVTHYGAAFCRALFCVLPNETFSAVREGETIRITGALPTMQENAAKGSVSTGSADAETNDAEKETTAEIGVKADPSSAAADASDTKTVYSAVFSKDGVPLSLSDGILSLHITSYVSQE